MTAILSYISLNSFTCSVSLATPELGVVCIVERGLQSPSLCFAPHGRRESTVLRRPMWQPLGPW